MKTAITEPDSPMLGKQPRVHSVYIQSDSIVSAVILYTDEDQYGQYQSVDRSQLNSDTNHDFTSDLLETNNETSSLMNEIINGFFSDI